MELPPVRLLVFAFALAISAIVATLATRLWVPPAPSPLHDWVLLKNALLPLLLLGVYARGVRLLERRPPTELAARQGLPLFTVGLAVGLVVIGVHVGVLAATGDARITRAVSSGDLLTLCNALLVPWLTAVGEELVFRAVLFRITEEMFGTAAGVLISAMLFALSHAGNPGADGASLVMLGLSLGAPLALAYAATRSLWLPIGLHMGWNVAQASLFGLPNSGMTDAPHLLQTSLAGSPLLTGGAFGPEASVIVVGMGVAATFALVRRTWGTDRWMGRRLRLGRVVSGSPAPSPSAPP